jgi:hypothetical protein
MIAISPELWSMLLLVCKRHNLDYEDERKYITFMFKKQQKSLIQQLKNEPPYQTNENQAKTICSTPLNIPPSNQETITCGNTTITTNHVLSS